MKPHPSQFRPPQARQKGALHWRPINRKKLPKTGCIIAGSFRGGRWSMSSPSDNNEGFPSWADSDRTHYMRIPIPTLRSLSLTAAPTKTGRK